MVRLNLVTGFLAKHQNFPYCFQIVNRNIEFNESFDLVLQYLLSVCVKYKILCFTYLSNSLPCTLHLIKTTIAMVWFYTQ